MLGWLIPTSTIDRGRRSATMRMCAVTRQVRPSRAESGVVVSPRAGVIQDMKRHKLPGRGLWVSRLRIQAVAEPSGVTNLERLQGASALRHACRRYGTLAGGKASS